MSDELTDADKEILEAAKAYHDRPWLGTPTGWLVHYTMVLKDKYRG